VYVTVFQEYLNFMACRFSVSFMVLAVCQSRSPERLAVEITARQENFVILTAVALE
jgi:cobalamin biosynthesis protein CobD/CbiB